MNAQNTATLQRIRKLDPTFTIARADGAVVGELRDPVRGTLGTAVRVGANATSSAWDEAEAEVLRVALAHVEGRRRKA